MCSLSFCFPRLWMLVGMGIALEKSGYPLQPPAAGAQCEQVEAFLVMVVGHPGWASCCSRAAWNSRVVFRVAGACGERVVSLGLLQAFHGHFCPCLEPLSWAPWALSSAWSELSPLSPWVEGSSVQHLGWQSVLSVLYHCNNQQFCSKSVFWGDLYMDPMFLSRSKALVL